jgi:hypothetical protein
VACQDLRDLGATVGYPHPALAPFGDDGSLDAFFDYPRSVEARELVADAALGLVDSVDVISPFDDEAAAFLYARLLSCGLRLAATAGTDVFLSFSHGPGVASNPPGWGRVYAHLGDQPLSVEAFQAAVRAGRTTVTNGPWLTWTSTVTARARCSTWRWATGCRCARRASGRAVERISLVGPDGELASGDGRTDLRYDLEVDGPSWIAAIARGPGGGDVLDAAALAHTSPVYLDVDGERGRPRRGRSLVPAWLDRLERLIREHGSYAPRDPRRADGRGPGSDRRGRELYPRRRQTGSVMSTRTAPI